MTVSGPRVRLAVWSLVCCLLTCSVSVAPALARSRPGPIDERGTAAHVGPRGFTLVTAHDGSFAVAVSPDTAVTMAGKRAAVGEGDHVGVRGFPSTRSIRAIWVHIYSRAVSKPFSIEGRVVSVQPGMIVVQAAGRTQSISVSATTAVVVAGRTGSVSDVRAGDRVLVRVQKGRAGLTALHIHVYARPRQSVQLSGKVMSMTSSSVTVSTATGVQTVRVPASAVIYLGNTRTTRSELHSGQTVRIYACCAGTSLSATSIHIQRARHRVVSEIVHGIVQHVTLSMVILLVNGRAITVVVNGATVVQIASAPARISGLRIGDQVTVRVHVVGGRLLAVHIDVPLASRTPRTIIGTIVAISGPRITVSARGKRYTLDLSGRPAITLAGARVSVFVLRVGDKVHAKGLLRGTVMNVASLSAVRPPVPVRTVRGTIVALHGDDLVIVDAAGVRHTVHIPPSVHPTIHGSPAPPSALFPGAHATVKGTVSGSSVLARSVSVSVEVRDLSGRLTAVTSVRLQMETSGRNVVVDLGGEPSVTDAGRRIAARSLRSGAFVEIRGYEPETGRIRATSVRVMHPPLDLRGILVLDPSGLSLRTSSGATYRVHVSEATQLSNEGTPVGLTIDDVPAGVRVHATGKARSDGSLAAQTMTVHLASITVRGSVVSVSGTSLIVAAGSVQQTVRLGDGAPVTQGSRTLQLADVVAGDDITVEGYQGRTLILARALLVHRALVGISGVIQATGSGGFILTTTGGAVRVAVSPDTLIAATLSPGAAVHVTGYRRGDGVILATRIRAGK